MRPAAIILPGVPGPVRGVDWPTWVIHIAIVDGVVFGAERTRWRRRRRRRRRGWGGAGRALDTKENAGDPACGDGSSGGVDDPVLVLALDALVLLSRDVALGGIR